MWVPINTAPTYGTKPYYWESNVRGQCTWGAYYRVQQNGYPAPVYNDRAKKIEGYNNGKTWLDNYKEPWVPIRLSEEPSYKPVPGDIIVWTGKYGHVAVIEVDNGDDTYGISSWNSETPEEYGYISKWELNSRIAIKYQKGMTTGDVIGYLHYDPKRVTPVAENPNVNQVYCNDINLYVRLGAGKSYPVYCFIEAGFYNVLSITENDNYRWFEIEPGKFCADIGWDEKTDTGIRYIPADIDPTKLIEENQRLKEALKQIADIANKFLA